MTEFSNSKQSKKYNLEERTFQFAKEIRFLVKKLPRTVGNIEDGKQLIRSSGSIGANYIEANESLSKKDFLMRVKISRKEAKESVYWLRLIQETNSLEDEESLTSLIQEGIELKKIFSAIIEKSK
ncbi:MAG: four helix bundle protein [Calditrichaeota bacterium]|nr:four helix bundle protein [Calditrichota bacterium]